MTRDGPTLRCAFAIIVMSRYQTRARCGAPEWLVDAWVSYTAIRDGELAAMSDDVPRPLDRTATSFGDAVAAR